MDPRADRECNGQVRSPGCHGIERCSPKRGPWGVKVLECPYCQCKPNRTIRSFRRGIDGTLINCCKCVFKKLFALIITPERGKHLFNTYNSKKYEEENYIYYRVSSTYSYHQLVANLWSKKLEEWGKYLRNIHVCFPFLSCLNTLLYLTRPRNQYESLIRQWDPKEKRCTQTLWEVQHKKMDTTQSNWPNILHKGWGKTVGEGYIWPAIVFWTKWSNKENTLLDCLHFGLSQNKSMATAIMNIIALVEKALVNLNISTVLMTDCYKHA